jgi:hypothetical protein
MPAGAASFIQYENYAHGSKSATSDEGKIGGLIIADISKSGQTPISGELQPSVKTSCPGNEFLNTYKF